MHRGSTILIPRRWIFVFLLAAVVLLLRGLELRLPGITSSINEDEIHHNYWLLEYNSVLGNFTIWQLQPLLEYLLRLYFWFPLLALTPLIRNGILAAFFAVAFGVWWVVKTGPDENKSRVLRTWQAIIFANLLIFLIAFIWLLDLLQGSSNEGLLGYSQKSMLFTLLAFGVLLGFFYLAVQSVRRARIFTSLIKATQKPKLAITTAVLCSLVFLIGSGLLLLWANKLIILSPSIDPFYIRTLPFQGALILLAFSLLWALASTQPLPARRIIIAVLMASFSVIGGLAFKTLGEHRQYTELMLKTPNLIYGLAVILIAFTLPFFYFFEKKISLPVCLLLSFICGLWVANLPLEISMSGFGAITRLFPLFP